MTTNNGDSGPQLRRTFNLELNSGNKLIYIADKPITHEEAGNGQSRSFGSLAGSRNKGRVMRPKPNIPS